VDYGGHAWEHEIEAFPFLCRNASDRPLFRTPNGRPEMELEVCEHRLLHHALRNLTCGIMAQNHHWHLSVGGDHSL